MSRIDGLADLFPLPSPPPSLCPQRFPGVSHESSTTLVKLLKDNHVRWHMYFNDRQFHNHDSHVAHLLLAMYQIGATPKLLEAGYRNDCTFQCPAYASPSAITDDNLYDHIGDERYYTAYREFFNAAVRKEGISAFLEKYLFTPEANAPPKRMLNRFLTGLLHPIIHAGYGCEFGLPGMVAEGLAQLCTQDDPTPQMFPPSVFSWHGVGAGTASSVAGITTSLSSVGLNGKANGSAVSTGPHALEILAKIANDPAFAPSAIGIPVENRRDLCEVLEARGPELFELVSAWTVDGADKDAVYRKIEEVVWMNVVVFGVAGWGSRHSTPEKKFNGDFILLHLVTSTLFLHSYVPYLSASSISSLVRAFFGASLGVYIARGRPALPIRDFYASTTAMPRAPGPAPTPHKDALTSTGITNPWFEVLQSTLAHKDDHLVKLQRALAHFATLYGTTPPGRFADLHGLNGAEILDGSLFLRVAGLSQDRAGWMREGEEDKFWDFQGFFNC
ncbi:hypothetical protein DAEQUDRAFT_673054 [Daedalea quercina L-15889]|uniref:Oxidoreductase AflY n=1 Tax=Daedalea quercina L-15889 TaxID=1314783 RepID=A0A165NXG6_9APHY|nr:hypothetical protein DAEQUDRAFT_673054 [Daedalea quercina L-15889]